MNKIVLIIVAVVIVFGAFSLFGNKKTTTTNTTVQPTAEQVTTQPSSQTTIALTEKGFLPSNIVVKVGTKVMWVNKSGVTATVNSDNHPTHLLYPFLNLGEFANNATLQVVFDKAGKYSYHNHLNPSERGTVTVE